MNSYYHKLIIRRARLASVPSLVRDANYKLLYPINNNILPIWQSDRCVRTPTGLSTVETLLGPRRAATAATGPCPGTVARCR